jgi:stage III sporulation protein AG
MKIPNLPEPLKKYGALLLVIAAGLLLLMWPRGAGPPAAETPRAMGETFELAGLERRLAQILSAIDGVGRAEVLLTLKTDMEVVVVQDTDTRSRRDAEDGTVLSSDDEHRAKTVLAGAAPIIQKRVYPEFQGALIVCDGAGSASVRTAVLDAVAALTGLRADSITVLKKANK